MCPPMDDNLETLPHVIITVDNIWNPTVLDHSIDPSNDTYDHTMDPHIEEEEFTSLDDCTSVIETIFIMRTMALTKFVKSITMNMSPNQDLISILLIIPIIYYPNE